MAFGGFSKSEAAPMAEINIIPLVDVMLVLLVIFIITAPVLTHAVKIDLPRASSQVNMEKPETITLSIDGDGRLYWNDRPIAEQDLAEEFAGASAKNSNVELHLRADKKTPYEILARILAAAQTHHVAKIGFVAEPAK